MRFLRVAERRIAEVTGRGVICYISNFSYVGHPSFVVLRKRLLGEFQKLWFDSLNGDSRETGKVTPAGDPDPSIFSTESNREGIRVGTAIGLFVKDGTSDTPAKVWYRDLWGRSKATALLESVSGHDTPGDYVEVEPTPQNRFSFRAQAVPARYRLWPNLADLSELSPISGPQEVRERAFVVPTQDREKLNALRMYLDPGVSDEAIRRESPRLMKAASGFDPVATRQTLLRRKVVFSGEKVVPYVFKPFDLQTAYLDSATHPLFFRPRPELIKLKGAVLTSFVVSRDTSHAFPEGAPLYFSTPLMDFHSIATSTKLIPIRLPPKKESTRARGRQVDLRGKAVPSTSQQSRANLSESARAYLRGLGLPDPDLDPVTGNLTWFHVLSIAYSPEYILENQGGIRGGWPRIPLPDSADALRRSAALGEALSCLLDPISMVTGVTTGELRDELATIGICERIGGGSLSGDRGEFDLTAGWGHGETITMPGHGSVVSREFDASEGAAISRGAKVSGKESSSYLELLGGSTFDVFLNELAFWKNIPSRVWEFRVGGCQVLKKWLSYRDRSILGRGLVPDELSEFSRMARRIAAIRLLEPELDLNYASTSDSAFTWLAH